MSRRFLPLVAICLFCSAPAALSQNLEPVPHPNHFIILVDASDSTSTSTAKRELYEKTLKEDLVSFLYREGFGPSIPAYDPSLDRLTLLHFGIVTGNGAPAYVRLSQYDFLQDFIHPVLIRREGISPTLTKNGIVPTQGYQYTVLSWAKQLALVKARPVKGDDVSNRTFMVIIHDGQPNENSARGEIDMVRRWGGSNFERVSKRIAEIDRDYRFTDLQGNESPLWTREIRTSDHSSASTFFIEAYEVLSTEQANWQAKGRSLHPLNQLALSWTNTSGNSPQGELTAVLSDEFETWARQATGFEVSLSAGPDGKNGSGPGLVILTTFEGALTCTPRTVEATLHATLRRTDPLLGRQTVIYSYTQPTEAPPPRRCTLVFGLWLGLIAIIILCSLIALTYYIYFRFVGNHLTIEIPGTLAPVNLRRKGRQTGRAPVVPQLGLEALSLKLPSWFLQTVFHRGTVMKIIGNAEDGPTWIAPGGPSELKLPLDANEIPAHWQRLPTAPNDVTVSFFQKGQQTEVTLTYPRTLTVRAGRSNPMSEISETTVYVALDLGSESMAAYYEDAKGNGAMIRMQDMAPKLFKGSNNDEPLALLLQEIDGAPKPSPRLWNRISFKDKAQPRVPADDHARLSFFDNDGKASLDLYNKSLFRFFHYEREWPPESYVMPNPKILFQQQVSDILAPIKIPATDGGFVQISPEFLINHLTLQVIVNFVLNSDELKGYPRSSIHLTITVPNVYSLPHSESIKDFIKRQMLDLADVDVLSESDAVAYYALKHSDLEKDPAALLAFKKALANELERVGKLCLVTIDVGKGTTDLSCILVQRPTAPPSNTLWTKFFPKAKTASVDRRRRHSVQGKTGKSAGGNYLNYILASYYDDRLREVAVACPLNEKQQLPFGFVVSSIPSQSERQRRALVKLEQLIERVKKSMNEECEIDEAQLSVSEQRLFLENVIDEILNAVNPTWKTAASAESKRRYDAFKAHAIESLTLPPTLEADNFVRKLKKFLKNLKHPANRRQDGSKDRVYATVPPPVTDGAPFSVEAPAPPAQVRPTVQTAELKRAISQYVKENVDDLIENLKQLVKEHQAVSDDRGSIDGSSFVVVSGQASQFKPLRAAIKTRCADQSIGDDQLYMMEGVASKEACCKGVVNFQLANMLTTNLRELHGTYGCMEYNFSKFKAFDMKSIKNGGTHTISFDEEGAYYVLFTPRSYDEVVDRPPEMNDGATALVGVFLKEYEFTIEYRPESLELRVNGAKLSISSFGNVDTSIYKKVWPEILKPFKE